MANKIVELNTWDMSVSHADAKPQPMEIPVTFITCIEMKYYSSRQHARIDGAFKSQKCTTGSRAIKSETITDRYRQRHPRQLRLPQVAAEDHADEADQEAHQLWNELINKVLLTIKA